MSLFQNSKSINGGKQKLTNMTNDALSSTACDAIEKELLDCEEIKSVSVVCTQSSDNQKDTCFSVWDNEGNSYLFSVDNEGIIFND